MKNDEVLEYLEVEWITEEEFTQAPASVGVKPKKTAREPSNPKEAVRSEMKISYIARRPRSP